MKKSIFLFFAAILCAMSANAKTLYLNPGVWTADNAWFAAYFYGNEDKWLKCTDDDGNGTFEVEAPDGYPNVIFCRMNKSNTTLGWGAKWNQTEDLTIPTDAKNLCSITGWGGEKSPSAWSAYDPLAVDVYLAGTMNGWSTATDQFKLTEAGSSIAELKKTIEADDYKLKIVAGGKWYTNKTGSITRDANTLIVNVDDSRDVPFNADKSGEYTFQWSINDKKLTVIYPEEEVVITHTYTVAGSESAFGTNWDASNTENDMTLQDDGTYQLEKTDVYAEANKDIEFKIVVDHSWDNPNYPENNYKLTITETAYYTITVTFNPETKAVAAKAVKTADAEAKTHTYTVAGSAALCGVEWDWNATDNDMTTEDNITYTWTKTGVEVAGILKFKVFEDHSNSTAYPQNDWEIKPENYGGNGVYTVTITFKADTKEVTVELVNTGKIDATYYITGSLPGLTWTPDETELTDNGDDTYGFSCTLAAAQQYEFKITTGKWAGDGGTEYTTVDKFYKGVSGGNGSNIILKLEDETEVTIIFNATTGKISFDGLEESTFTVAGSEAAFGTAWDATNWENNMTLQDDGTYVWSRGGLYLTENVEFKVVKDYNFENGAWPSENWVLKIGQDQDNKPGYYKLTIYYNPSNNDITVVATPQEVQNISLTFDNLQIEKVDYEGTTVLNLSASEGMGWFASTQVAIYLNNYTGENTEYDVMSESDITYEYNNAIPGTVSGKLKQSYADELYSFTGTVNAVLEVYNEEEDASERVPYQFTLTLNEPTPVSVTITNATVSLNDNEGALTLTSTFTFEGENYPTSVKLSGFESLVATKTYNAPQCGEIQMGGDGDSDPWLDFAVANTVDVSYNGNTIQLKGVFKSWNTGTSYSVTISGTVPTVQLGGGNNSTVISNNAGKLVMVEMDRTFTTNDGYYTLCVPFNIMAAELGTVHTITSVTKAAAEGFNVNFSEVETIEAGYPYLLEPSVNLTNPKFVVNLKNATAQTSSAAGQGLSVSMTGVLTTTETETTDGLYWVGNSGYLYNDDVTKLSLRSYFTITSASGIAPRMRVVTGENVETGVEDIFSTDAPVKAIVNGQLIIIRDGVKYNVQGQVIK